MNLNPKSTSSASWQKDLKHAGDVFDLVQVLLTFPLDDLMRALDKVDLEYTSPGDLERTLALRDLIRPLQKAKAEIGAVVLAKAAQLGGAVA
jgi:hypothetical protein